MAGIFTTFLAAELSHIYWRNLLPFVCSDICGGSSLAAARVGAYLAVERLMASPFWVVAGGTLISAVFGIWRVTLN